jgi:membrane protein involved in colicin uptake
MTHTFRHPKHYKEMRAERRKPQAIQAPSKRQAEESAKQQAPSKRQAEESAKPQASSPKQQASSFKPEATSSVIREPGNI